MYEVLLAWFTRIARRTLSIRKLKMITENIMFSGAFNLHFVNFFQFFFDELYFYESRKMLQGIFEIFLREINFKCAI